MEGLGVAVRGAFSRGRSIVFSERGIQFISCSLCRPFRCSGNHSVLLYEVLWCIGLASVATFLPFLHHWVFEDTGLVNSCNELRHFIVVGDLDVVLCGVVLPPFEVSRVGDIMLVGGVAPGGNESCLRCHHFCVGNDRPSAKVSDKRWNSLHTIP